MPKEKKLTTTVHKSGEEYLKVSVPIQLARAKGWSSGTRLSWTVEEDGKIRLEEA